MRRGRPQEAPDWAVWGVLPGRYWLSLAPNRKADVPVDIVVGDAERLLRKTGALAEVDDILDATLSAAGPSLDQRRGTPQAVGSPLSRWAMNAHL